MSADQPLPAEHHAMLAHYAFELRLALVGLRAVVNTEEAHAHSDAFRVIAGCTVGRAAVALGDLILSIVNAPHFPEQRELQALAESVRTALRQIEVATRADQAYWPAEVAHAHATALLRALTVMGARAPAILRRASAEVVPIRPTIH